MVTEKQKFLVLGIDAWLKLKGHKLEQVEFLDLDDYVLSAHQAMWKRW